MAAGKNKTKNNKKILSLFNMKGEETEHYKALKELFKKRNIGPYDSLLGIENVPAGLSSKKIWDLLQGKGCKTIYGDHLDWLISTFSVLPEVSHVVGSKTVNESKTYRRLGKNYIPLSIETVRRLNDLSAQTNLKPYEFLRLVKKKAPNNLTANSIECWMDGSNKRADKESLEFVLQEWEIILSEQSNFINITEAIREELLSHKARTGLTQKSLFRGIDAIPDGFNPKWINGWLSGRIKTANPHHLEYVLGMWQKAPDKGWYSSPGEPRKSHPLKPRVKKKYRIEEISDETRELLKNKFKVKNITLSSFLRRFHPETSEITVGMLSNWMTGKTKTTTKEQLSLVLSKLDSLPDVILSEPDVNVIDKQEERSTIKNDVREEMLYHKNRTGVGGSGLLKSATNIPEGLSGNMINSWLNGYVKTAEVSHIKYVVDLWKQTPDKS